MASQRIDQRAAAQAAWREMARGMRKFIEIEMSRGADRGVALAYVQEQIGVALADAAGRLCMEGQPIVLTPAECADLANTGYAMQHPREPAGGLRRHRWRVPAPRTK